MSFSATYTCHQSGAVSYAVAYIAVQASFLAWLGVSGAGYYDSGQLLLIILNAFWLVLLLQNWTLQEAFQEPRLCQGHAKEDGVVLYGNPSIEAQLIFTFIVFLLLFNFSRTKRFRRNHVLSLLFVLVLVTWGLWWTGNYEFRHVASGAVVGVAMALLLYVGIYHFWAEDFPAILNLKMAEWWGLKDSFCVPALGLGMYCDEVKVCLDTDIYTWMFDTTTTVQ